jgi:hypothetical protein
MPVPNFYLVADGNAYALDKDGVPFGAPVNTDGSIDWECAYDFAPNEEDVEYVAHICQLLIQAQALTTEFHHEVFVK